MQYDVDAAVKKRRSVRTFAPGGLNAEDRAKLEEFIAQCTNPLGIPVTFRLLDAKEYGLGSPVIVGTELYLAGKTAQSADAALAFGWEIEDICLYAASCGIGTTVIGGTVKRAPFEQAISLAAGEMMPAVTPVGYPAEKMSVREKMMRAGVKADERLAFASLFYSGSFEKPLDKTLSGRLLAPLKAVRQAPSAVNKQPWRLVITPDAVHFYEKQTLGGGKDGGLDIQMLDMGIAMLHFARAAHQCGISGEFAANDPQLAVPDNTHYVISYRY